MQTYYSKTYENAIFQAWQTKDNFYETSFNHEIGEIVCIKIVDQQNQPYMQIFVDEYLHETAPNFDKI